MILTLGQTDMKRIGKRIRAWVERTSLTVWIVLAVFAGAPIYTHIRRLRLPDLGVFQALRAQAKWMLPCQVLLFGLVLCATLWRWKHSRKELKQAQHPPA